ncbi:MAG: PaaI family thioesterase [Alphaproteobacteria bacterium]|nr:PaaI family thioesterase [Alphaproteobacteria bacterium]
MAIDRDHPEKYPPNIQAILKRPAPGAVVLGQEILDVNVEAGSVRVAYNTTEALANRYGAIHGGMTAAMLDDVISLASGLTVEWGQITPTLEMKVSYIAQGKVGARILAEARTIRRGGTVMFLEADLKDETGKLIATASSTVMIAQMKR